jgi:hypothetical protein
MKPTHCQLCGDAIDSLPRRRLHWTVITKGYGAKAKRLGSLFVCRFCLDDYYTHTYAVFDPTEFIPDDPKWKTPEDKRPFYAVNVRSIAASLLYLKLVRYDMPVLALAIQCKVHGPRILKELSVEQQVQLDAYLHKQTKDGGNNEPATY